MLQCPVSRAPLGDQGPCIDMLSDLVSGKTAFDNSDRLLGGNSTRDTHEAHPTQHGTPLVDDESYTQSQRDDNLDTTPKVAVDENLPRPAARRDSIQNNPFIVADRKLKPPIPSSSITSAPDGKESGFRGRYSGTPSEQVKVILAERLKPSAIPSQQRQGAAEHTQSKASNQNRQGNIPNEPAYSEDNPASKNPKQIEMTSQDLERGIASSITRSSTSGDNYESIPEASYDSVASHIIRYIHGAVSHLAKKERQPRGLPARVDDYDDELGDQLTNDVIHSSSPEPKVNPGNPGRKGRALGNGMEQEDTFGSTKPKLNVAEVLKDVFNHPVRASMAYTAFSCEESQSADTDFAGHSDKPNHSLNSNSPSYNNILATSDRLSEGSRSLETQSSHLSTAAPDEDAQRLNTDVATPKLTEDDGRKRSLRLVDRGTSAGNRGTRNPTQFGYRQAKDVDTNYSSLDARQRVSGISARGLEDRVQPDQENPSHRGSSKISQHLLEESRGSKRPNDDNLSRTVIARIGDPSKPTSSVTGSTIAVDEHSATKDRRGSSKTKLLDTRQATGDWKPPHSPKKSTSGSTRKNQLANEDVSGLRAHSRHVASDRQSSGRLPLDHRIADTLPEEHIEQPQSYRQPKSIPAISIEPLEAQAISDVILDSAQKDTRPVPETPHRSRRANKTSARTPRDSGVENPTASYNGQHRMVDSVPERLGYEVGSANTLSGSETKGVKSTHKRDHSVPTPSMGDQDRDLRIKSLLVEAKMPDSESEQIGKSRNAAAMMDKPHSKHGINDKATSSTSGPAARTTANVEATPSKIDMKDGTVNANLVPEHIPRSSAEQLDHDMKSLAEATYEAGQNATDHRRKGDPSINKPKLRGKNASLSGPTLQSAIPSKAGTPQRGSTRGDAGHAPEAVRPKVHRAARSEAMMYYAYAWRNMYTDLASDLSLILSDVSRTNNADPSHSKRMPYDHAPSHYASSRMSTSAYRTRSAAYFHEPPGVDHPSEAACA